MADKKKKNSFLLYTTGYTSAVAKMSKDRKADAFDAIYAYAGTEKAVMPELDEVLEAVLAPIFEAMDRAAAEYEAVCQKRAEGGKLGGRPKTKRLGSEPQGTENNLKDAKGTLRGHEGRQGGISKHKNPYNDNEYDNDTTTAKSNNILTTTKLCSIDYREENNLKVPLATLRGHEQPEAPLSDDNNPFGYNGDQPPPDYDPAEAFGCDPEDSFTESDGSAIDRPF